MKLTEYVNDGTRWVEVGSWDNLTNDEIEPLIETFQTESNRFEVTGEENNVG